MSLSESGSTCTFFHQGWSRLAMRINDTTIAITGAEKEAFEILRNNVCPMPLPVVCVSYTGTDHLSIGYAASECTYY